MNNEEILEYLNDDKNLNKYVVGNDLSLDTKIYRAIKLDYFYDMVSGKSNSWQSFLRFSKPKDWDDPCENALLDSIYTKEKDFDSVSDISTYHFYAYCWTMKNECDGFWRNYASLDNGVIISTTVRKLLQAIIYYIPGLENTENMLFVGKVEYHDMGGLKNEIEKIFKKNKKYYESLLLKREEFDYEREVRVMIDTGGYSILKFPNKMTPDRSKKEEREKKKRKLSLRVNINHKEFELFESVVFFSEYAPMLFYES